MTEIMWNNICYVSFALVIAAIAICFLRMIIGPDMSDRVLALDLTSNLLISFIAIYSLYSGQSVYIDVILALALIVFLTTVAFANLMLCQPSREKLSVKRGSKS